MHFICPLNQTSANVEIFSVSSFDESILKQKPTVIFVDLDDTVFTPGNSKGLQFFCSTNWFIIQTLLATPEKLKWHIDLFTVCANETSYLPVSPTLNTYLQAATIDTPVIGLTARNEDTIPGTFKALSSIGFSFTNYPHPEIFNGVIFAGSNLKTGHSNHKGKVILRIISSMKMDSSFNLLVIDDSLKNILQINDSLTNNGIEATLIHLNSISQMVFSTYAWDEVLAISQAQQQYYLDSNRFIPNEDIIGSNQCFAPGIPSSI